MNKKITLCLLSLFFNTSFAQDCLEPNDLTEQQKIELLEAKRNKEEAYDVHLVLGSICNLLYISQAAYLFAKYSSRPVCINNTACSDDYRFKELIDLDDGILFANLPFVLAKKNYAEVEKIRPKAFRFWAATYIVAMAISSSSTGYKFSKYLERVKKTGVWFH